MLKEERHHYILARLAQQGRVEATTLSADLQVSEDTIRRDLNELAEAHHCQRVHGGALALGSLPRYPSAVDFAERRDEPDFIKKALARAALPLLHAGDVVFLDGGTTNLEVARIVPATLILTIVTNSPPIATILASHPTITVIVLGGQLLKAQQVTVGSATLAALATIHADVCLLGICSLHPDRGITALNYEEAFVKQAMLAQATTRVALVSAAKLGTGSPYAVAPITQLTHLVTESTVPDEQLAPYREQGITVFRASPTAASPAE